MNHNSLVVVFLALLLLASCIANVSAQEPEVDYATVCFYAPRQ